MGAVSVLCSRLRSTRRQRIEEARIWLVPVVLFCAAIIHVELGRDGIWVFSPVVFGILYLAIRYKDEELLFDRVGYSLPVFVLNVLTIATIYPDKNIVGCLILASFLHVIIIAYIRARTLSRSWKTVLIVGAFLPIVLPWYLHTIFGPLKHMLCATTILSVCALVDLRFRRRFEITVGVLLLAGTISAAIFSSLERSVAYGSFPVDSMFGRVMNLVHSKKELRSIESEVAADSCQTPRAKGVVWIVIDAVRFDDIGASSTLEHLADSWTFFANSYSPSHSTVLAYAMWMRGTLPHVPYEWPSATTLTETIGSPKTAVLMVDMLEKLPQNLMAGDVDSVEGTYKNCSGEGERVVELTKNHQFVLAYFGAPHEPYECNDPSFGEKDYDCYREELRCVGQEIEALREFKSANPNWAVIVTSDHGESFAGKYVRYHSSRLWQEQIRVPTWISGPGFESGERSDLHSNRSLSADVSCWLTGENRVRYPSSSTSRKAIVVHGFGPTQRAMLSVRESAVIEGDWKLIYDWDTEFIQVFNLKNDRLESQNLADQRTDIVDRLSKHLFKK